MSSFDVLAATMAATLLAVSSPAYADDGDDAVAGQILVTGTRSDRTLSDEPYANTVIDQEQLAWDLPRTVPEALNAIPGVLVQKTASGHGSPYIRGFTGNRTLMVIDGVRYNNATYRDGASEYFAQVDSFTLSQIELVSGPSSSLYGSEAVGGTLSLSTRPSSVLEQTGQFIAGEQTVRLSSGNHSVVSRTALDIGEGGAWGLRGGFTLREYGDVRAAELGRLPNTGYSERAFDARLDFVIDPQWTATITHQSLWQNDVPRTHSTVFSVPFAGTQAGTDLRRDKDHERSLTYSKLRGVTDHSWLSTLDVTVSYQSRREDEDRVRGDGLMIDQGFTSDLFALNAVAAADLGKFSLTYGFDLSREHIDSARRDTDPGNGTVLVRLQGPVGDDARYDQAGVFARGIVNVSETLSLEASLRGSYVDASVGQFADPATGLPRAFDDSWTDLSGSMRAQFKQDEHVLWAAYSRSFRVPNIADISRFGRSRTNEIEIASLALSPETFDTFEIAYRGRWDGIEFGATAYTTRLIDYIASVPAGNIRDGLIEVARRNAASGRISGIELSFGADLAENLRLDSHATWLRGRLTMPSANGPVKEPISRIQPLTGYIALTWEREEKWLKAELSLVDKADELSSGDLLDVERIPLGGTPGYTLFNIRGGLPIADGAELTVAFNNLLDTAYRAHGSGNNEPGRHILAGLSFAF